MKIMLDNEELKAPAEAIGLALAAMQTLQSRQTTPSALTTAAVARCTSALTLIDALYVRQPADELQEGLLAEMQASAVALLQMPKAALNKLPADIAEQVRHLLAATRAYLATLGIETNISTPVPEAYPEQADRDLPPPAVAE